MERNALLLSLLADLLGGVELETIVVEPMADDFPETVPANYWPMEETRDE
jgi:hypothetical protein